MAGEWEMQIVEILLVQGDHFNGFCVSARMVATAGSCRIDFDFPEIRAGRQAGNKDIAAVRTVHVDHCAWPEVTM